MTEHQPVLLKEVLVALDINPNGIYVDATFGRGGHTKSILDKLGENGKILVIDKDPEAIAVAEKLNDPRVHKYHGSYENIEQACNEFDIYGKISGVLLDLGVSSPQLDNPSRGFSFQKDGPLDMRMDPTKGISAAEWLKQAEEREIFSVLKNYGEERFAKRIANAIVTIRKVQSLDTTRQLAKIIANAVPVHDKNKHPATRSFQGIRIFINQELKELENCLPQLLNILQVNGIMAIITFHSLEDRIVKSFIKNQASNDKLPRDFPIRQSQLQPRLVKVSKAVKPGNVELQENRRSRSAKLHIARKVA